MASVQGSVTSPEATDLERGLESATCLSDLSLVEASRLRHGGVSFYAVAALQTVASLPSHLDVMFQE